jgi:predicted phosphodiesterase
MRLAVLSDVHANLPALEAVVADFRQFNPDGIIVAGDLIAGPFPNETIHYLRTCAHPVAGSGSQGCWMILGNTDINLLRYFAGQTPETWRSSRQYALLRWNHRNITAETTAFLHSLPEQCRIELPGAAPIRVVHGTPRDPYESIFPESDPATLDRAFSQIVEPVLVCGHTHQPWWVEREGRLALNPGSVAGPLNDVVGAQYALLNWNGSHWQVELLCVPYDLRLIRKAFIESGLLEEGGALAQAFLLSIETGQNVGEHFLTYAYGLAEKAGFPGCKVVPDDIWDAAAASFNWSVYQVRSDGCSPP